MRPISTRIITGITMSCTLAIASISYATDLHVPLPYVTVQQAIDAAATGDTVYLAPGVYSENIKLNGKNITVRAFNTNFDTVIDGGQAGPVVTFSGSESDKCVLRDLILRNGKAAQGAGILGNSSFATVRNCTIGGNLASGAGGGVHGLSGTMKNCNIILNQAANGGGVAACDGLIDGCNIAQNKATQTGGGIFGCEGVIQFSEISQNEAATAGGGINQTNAILFANLVQANAVTATGPSSSPASWGGGINDLSGLLSLNTIVDNTSGGDGGGIANSDAIMQNNVIAFNMARRGGGLAACTGRIENNTIWGNAANASAGGCLNLGPDVANCIIAANNAPVDAEWAGVNVPTYSCIPAWTGGQPDILTLDPMLENPSKGKFRLMAGSPCIDAGRFVADLAMDFDGDARPIDGSAELRGDGSDFDIGADEYAAASFSYDIAAAWSSVKTKYKGSFPKLKGKIQGKLVVANVGTENINAPFGIQFFGSADAVFDASDFPVGKYVTAKKLKAGKSKKAKCKIKLPVNLMATGYYLIAVADVGNAVGEINEGNNIAVWGPLP